MKAEQWEQIKTLFNAALDVDKDERVEFLADRCADTKIRRQVSLMLLADEDDGDDFADIVQDAAGDSFGQTIRPGDQIGRWRIVREIDRGGMGAVYLAERADSEYEQKVAIKFVTVALAGSQAVMRFKSERQILARLEHPNIARLLDGGTTASGVPYLVMEYVDGVRIDRYCDRHRLHTTDRLRLFQQVCAAINVAHQNLVVHRDIKPGNILVTAGGVPKLLDFGIAKLLDPADSGAGIAVTHANMRLLTPEYASPEQVLGRPVTTASDIYSLGVLLFQILAGRPPYNIADYSTESLAKAICETDPQRPSTVAATLSGNRDDDEQVFHARRTTRQGLRKRLRGDLDNIVLMAMRKEPERRYPSALRLAEDIDHYLRDLPVIARTDTLAYRLGKYLRRNAAAVTATAIATLAVVALVAFYTQRLSTERDRAQSEALKATQTADFLQNLFRIVDPEVAQGDEVTARSLLDQGARQLAVTLEDQPEVRASLQETIGKVYGSLGLFDDAEPLYKRALATYTELYGEQHPGIIPILRQMAELANQQGLFDKADSLNTQALEQARALYGDEHAHIAAGERVAGVLLSSRGEYAGARDALTRARAILERLGETGHPEYARTLTSLALVYDNLGDYDASIALLEDALIHHRELYGRIHPLTTAAQHALAIAQDRQHLYEAAETNYLEALENSIRLFGDVHPDVGSIQGDTGRLYNHMGRPADGRVYLEAALDTSRKIYGARHHYIGYDMVAIAKMLGREGEFDEAEAYFREALDIYEESLPQNHPYKAAALVSFGKVLIDQGRPAKANEILARGREICAATLPEDHWLAAQMDLMQGVSLIQLGRPADGGPLLRDGFDRLMAASGVEHGATQYALTQLLDYLEASGDTAAYARYSTYRREPNPVE